VEQTTKSQWLSGRQGCPDKPPERDFSLAQAILKPPMMPKGIKYIKPISNTP
jgi:hypothetical protein